MISTLFLIARLSSKFASRRSALEVTLHHWNTASFCCCPCRLAYDLTLPEGVEGVKGFLGGALGMVFAGSLSVSGFADDVAGSVVANHFNLVGNT